MKINFGIIWRIRYCFVIIYGLNKDMYLDRCYDLLEVEYDMWFKNLFLDDRG